MIRILFVCVHNAGRSVMAEAFCKALAPTDVFAVSAGTIPADAPHPEVVQAMKEVGLDVSEHRGHLIDDETVAVAQRVITMGCAVDDDACPAIRLAHVEDWGLDDPAGQPIERVREIRDEVRARVQRLLSSL